MEQVEISIDEGDILKVVQRWDLGASLWRSRQDGFEHHRVDKPQQCDDESEFNRLLKFGFVAACCLAVLTIIICAWLVRPPSLSPIRTNLLNF